MYRSKYRIWWYGELFREDENPVLELKMKKGFVGGKHSFLLKTFRIQKGIGVADFKNVIKDSKIDTWIEAAIETQGPIILNRYRRKYFQSADKQFSITIDDQQSFYKIKPHENSFLEKLDDFSNVIIELKYDKELGVKADKITGDLPFMITKSSKYARAIELLYT